MGFVGDGRGGVAWSDLAIVVVDLAGSYQSFRLFFWLFSSLSSSLSLSRRYICTATRPTKIVYADSALWVIVEEGVTGFCGIRWRA